MLTERAAPSRLDYRVRSARRADARAGRPDQRARLKNALPNRIETEHQVNDNAQHADDLAILEQLNLDYIRSDETSDAKRFSEFLAEDFITQTPGVTRNREEYLEYIAKPRPIKDITLHE